MSSFSWPIPVIDEELTSVTQGANTTESYTYDAVGNRLSALGVSPYSYNVSNQLTAKPGVTYTYDSKGNALTKVDSSGTSTYAWDFENRLSSVTLPGRADQFILLFEILTGALSWMELRVESK